MNVFVLLSKPTIYAIVKKNSVGVDELIGLIEIWQPVKPLLIKKSDKKQIEVSLFLRGFDIDYIGQFQRDSGGKSGSYLKLILTQHKATKVIGR